jgi:hypothetical protein
MADNREIIELKRKILELEKLRNDCTLTNEIKDLLNKSIALNEEISEKFKVFSEKYEISKLDKSILIISEIKWVISILIIFFTLFFYWIK